MPFNKIKTRLKSTPKTWLITGVAGFIGSNLLEMLLALDQKVIGLDNFSTGHPHNMGEVANRHIGPVASFFIRTLAGMHAGDSNL